MTNADKIRLFDRLMGGGEAPKAGILPKCVPQEEFERGIEVEREHSPDRVVKAKISLDHFAELGDMYYVGLDLMERVMEGDKLDKLIEAANHMGIKTGDLAMRFGRIRYGGR